MQRQLRNLAVALVAGTFAVAAGAQDKGEKAAKPKADASAKMGDVKAKIDRRTDQIDAKMAVQDAADAEADAMVAIEGAGWAVENARLQTLDAIDARAHAEQRAKAAGLS